MIYVPVAQEPFWGAEIVVMGRLRADDAGAAIRAVAHKIDPALPVTNVESLPEAMSESVA